MSKHTPGPWEWNYGDYSMATLQGPNGMEDSVLAVSPCDACIKTAEKEGKWKWGRCLTPIEANANLIAAAPDLLEALHNLLTSINIAIDRSENDTFGIHHNDAMDNMAAAAAAIAKAKGAKS